MSTHFGTQLREQKEENFVGWSYKKLLDEFKSLENVYSRVTVIDKVHSRIKLDLQFFRLNLELHTPISFCDGQEKQAFEYIQKYPENVTITRTTWG
jgi:hypothetical protein